MSRNNALHAEFERLVELSPAEQEAELARIREMCRNTYLGATIRKNAKQRVTWLRKQLRRVNRHLNPSGVNDGSNIGSENSNALEAPAV